MMQTKTEAINCPYPTTNTPSLTIHHTLIVCEAVHCVCPWNDERDAKENNLSDGSDQFSQKQLWNAMILVLWRQKPLTNAQDGLYLPCVDRMLEACWVEGVLCHCWGVHVSDGKVAGGSPSPTWCRFSPHMEVVLHRMSLPGETILNPLPLPLTLCYPDQFTRGRFTCSWWIWFE